MTVQGSAELLAHFNILVDGQQASPEMMHDLLECTVENSLHLPDMCVIRVNDAKFEWIDDAAKFTEGKSLEVQSGYQGQTLVTIFKGEIVGLELDMAAHGLPTMVIRGLSLSHRLHHGRYTRAFQNMTDSDIARDIAGKAGLSIDSDATSVVHDHLIQCNQTNWEFLSQRAARCGYRLYMDRAGKCCFKKVIDPAATVVDLEWSKELISFRPRTAASTQVDSVIVRGWDPKTKAAITSQTSPSQALGMPKVQLPDGSSTAKRAFGAAEMEVVTQVVQSTSEADALAKSVAETIAGHYLEADGLCRGAAELRPGIYVNIKNIGTRFAGKYYVTSATHIYTPAEGYTTLFSVSGKQANNVLAQCESPYEISQRSLGDNIAVGIVTNNLDPDKMGRVKVKYPWLQNDQIKQELESHWARIASQMAGKDRGDFNLPEVDDEVLVAFEHGDINRPYVLGMLWNGKDTFPCEGNADDAGGKVNHRGYKTRVGHLLIFNDDGNKIDFTVTTKGGHVFTIDDKNKKIETKTTGGHLLVMDDQGKKVDVKTTSGHQVTLDDGGSSITVKDSAGNQVVIKDTGEISIKANMKISLQAPQIEIKAQAMCSIDGGGMTDIKGGLVKINS